MKTLLTGAVVATLLLPASALATDTPPAPKDSAAAACKAERAQMGTATFKATYGTNRNRTNALGKCVSKRTKTEKSGQEAARKACTAEQSQKGKGKAKGKGKKDHDKCVKDKSKTSTDATTKAHVNAAKACKAERAANPAAFKAKYGTNKKKSNAFGKCVSQKAKKPYALPA